MEEQLQLLRQRARARGQGQGGREKRLAVTKEKLVKSEGIQDKRLPAGAAKKPADGAAEGGVEFAIGEGEQE